MKRTILAKNLTTGEVLEFESALEASKKHGFDSSHITKCCRGRRSKHKGFKWSYHLPIKSITESIEENPWTIEEYNIMKTHFKSGDLSELLVKLPKRNFREILCCSKILKIKRSHSPASSITPLDLIQELAEDVLFT